ncbi:MAG TPA: pitrilysin family protein [Pyrinomonadaceae bacterium]|nr:pitrilysin family protein [Pyrinomonadaceae bacterium]
MRSIRILLVAIVTLAGAVSAFSQDITEFDVNGLKVIVKVRPNTATVAAGLFVRGGVRNQTPQNAGIENFMLKSAAEGSKAFPRTELRRELARTGATIGASSGMDFSVMSLSSTREHFARSWNAFSDLAMNPTFLPADVDNVREGILTGIRGSSDSPESFLNVKRNELVFKGHPYSLDADGSLETIQGFKPSDLAAYHKKVMTTSQLLLVVVGDVDVNDLKAKVTATLGKLPVGSYKDTAIQQVDFSRASLDVASRPIPTNYVAGLFASPTIGEPDYYAMRVATSILGSRMFTEVRVKNNLSYAPEASIGSQRANVGTFSVSTTSPNRAVAIILDEIKKLKNGEVSDEDIAETSGFFLTQHYMKLETNAAQAGDLASYELIGGGWRRSTEFMNKIRSVKRDEVIAAAKKYMTNFRYVVVGDPNSIDRKVFLGN